MKPKQHACVSGQSGLKCANASGAKMSKSSTKELRSLLWRLRQTEMTNPPPPTSLWQAANQGNVEAARLFIARGDPVNSRGGETPLHEAAASGNLEMVELLLSHGAEVQPKAALSSPLREAAERGHLHVVQRLLPLCKPELEEWTIPEAARHGQLECLKSLWKAKVSRQNAGYALLYAVEAGFYDCVKFLVRAGVNPQRHPNYAEEGGPRGKQTSAIRVAETKKRQHILDLLRGRPVDEAAALAAQQRTLISRQAAAEAHAVQYEKARPESAPPYEAEKREQAIFRAKEILAGSPTQIVTGAPSRSQAPLLELAVETGEIDLVRSVLALRAKPTPAALYCAVRQGFCDIVRLLMEQGADVKGLPMLIAAAERDNPDLVQMLLDAGADPQAKDELGQTAWKFTKGAHGEEIRKLLENRIIPKHLEPRASGLQIVAAKGGAVTDAVSGLRCFLSNSPNREWIVIMIRAPIQKVAEVLVRLRKPVRWEQKVARKAVCPAEVGLFLFQFKGNDWTTLPISYDWGSEFEDATRDASNLSKELRTLAIGYYAEDTAGVQGYEMFDKGRKTAAASFDGERIVFVSQTIAKPHFGKLFPDTVFTELGIVVAPFWIRDDGRAVTLQVANVAKGSVARVDFLAFREK